MHRRSKQGPLLIGRVISISDSKVYTVTLDPFELELEQLPESELLFFDERLPEYLSSVKQMEKLIHSPVEEFLQQLHSDIRQRSVIFLQEQGINVPMLKRFAKNEVSLLESNVVKVVVASCHC